MLLSSWALLRFSVRLQLTGISLFPFNHHMKTPKLLFMADKFQNNFLNNNDLITSTSSCTIQSDVALKLNVHSVEKIKIKKVNS